MRFVLETTAPDTRAGGWEGGRNIRGQYNIIFGIFEFFFFLFKFYFYIKYFFDFLLRSYLILQRSNY